MQWWETARAQGGVIGIGQLRSLGVHDTRIGSMVRRDALVAVLPGVYRWAATPLTVRGRRYAAALWSGGAVSFGTAGAMWDLGVESRSTVVDVSVRDRISRNGHPEFVRVHRVVLGARDVELIEGLAITTRARTTLDLVGSLSRDDRRVTCSNGASAQAGSPPATSTGASPRSGGGPATGSCASSGRRSHRTPRPSSSAGSSGCCAPTASPVGCRSSRSPPPPAA